MTNKYGIKTANTFGSPLVRRKDTVGYKEAAMMYATKIRTKISLISTSKKAPARIRSAIIT